MRRIALAAAAFAVLAVGAARSPAEPATPGAFPSFFLALDALRPTATESQVAAIDAARALYTDSTAATVSAELKLMKKMFKQLDRAFAGDAAYESARGNLDTGVYITRVGLLPPQAALAAVNGGINTILSVQRKISKLTNKLDLDGNGTPGEASDYAVNPNKFRGRELKLAKFCEGVIRKHG